MNTLTKFIPILLLLFPIFGCSSDPTEPHVSSPDAGLDLGVDASPDEGPTDSGDIDAEQDVTDDANEQDAGPDAGDAGETPDLPFRGELTMTGDSSRKATFPVEVSADGVLVVELFDASVDLHTVTFRICGSEGSCLGTSFRAPPRTFVPMRSLSNVTPGSYELEFSISRFTEPEGPQTVEVGVNVLTFQVIDAPTGSFEQAQELDLPGAFRVTLTAGVPAWFKLDLLRPGFTSIQRTNNDTYLCDMELWAANPGGCRSGSGRETERDVERGLLYLLSQSSFDTTRDFLVFHDEDPNALVCPIGEHLAGDGTCAPEGSCAPGYHDGGWGRCVADGTCSTNFELQSDGRCAGWVAAGEFDVFDSVNEVVLAGPNDSVIVGGYRRNANNDRVYAPRVWDPDSQSWSTADPNTAPEGTRRICPVSDGRVLTMRYGGFVTTAPADSERLFDPSTGMWSTPLNTPGISWTRPTCLLLRDGRTLVFEAGRARFFDPFDETWESTGSLSTGSDYVAVETAPGVVFAAGHNTNQSIRRHLWRWDANDGLWTETPDWMLDDELDNDHFMVAFDGDPVLFLTDGRVVRFDSATNEWEELPPIEVANSTMLVRRVSSRGEEVLFAYHAQNRAGVGVYDVDAGQWRALPPPVIPNIPKISGSDYLLLGRYPQRLQFGD